MDQYTRKLQKTRIFTPAPKTAISGVTTATLNKPSASSKRTFDQALDTKLAEYLARKAASKKSKLDHMVLTQPKNEITKTVVANRKIMQSSTRKVENPSTLAAALNEISQKDRPRNYIGKKQGFGTLIPLTRNASREAEENKVKASSIRDNLAESKHSHAASKCTAVAKIGKPQHTVQRSIKDTREESKKTLKMEKVLDSTCKTNDKRSKKELAEEISSPKKGGVGGECMVKSPRKLMLIDIPKRPAAKVLISNKIKSVEPTDKVTENVKEEKKCEKLNKTKPIKSLRERLVSGRKFTFSAASTSSVRRNDIVKERLAKLAALKATGGYNSNCVEQKQAPLLAATQQKTERQCDLQALRNDMISKKTEINDEDKSMDGLCLFAKGLKNVTSSNKEPSTLSKESSILSREESSSSSDDDSDSSSSSEDESSSSSESDEESELEFGKDTVHVDKCGAVANKNASIDNLCPRMLGKVPSFSEGKNFPAFNSEGSSSMSSDDDSDSSSEGEVESEDEILGKQLELNMLPDI